MRLKKGEKENGREEYEMEERNRKSGEKIKSGSVEHIRMKDG